MSVVVFLRGVNVGGHKAFRPSVLARELTGFDVASIGAAGTFVVRGAVAPGPVRSAFVERLPFDTHLMVCPGRDLLDLVRRDPFQKAAAGSDERLFISVLERRPARLPPLPLHTPDGTEWQVAMLEVRGRFVASLHRRRGRTFLYPNEAVEKRLGVAATTRSWSTILSVGLALEESAPRTTARPGPGPSRRSPSQRGRTA
ncbi:MAG: DUF1697 domain-containing protein [Gemmatimonadales bacterium]